MWDYWIIYERVNEAEDDVWKWVAYEKCPIGQPRFISDRAFQTLPVSEKTYRETQTI